MGIQKKVNFKIKKDLIILVTKLKKSKKISTSIEIEPKKIQKIFF